MWFFFLLGVGFFLFGVGCGGVVGFWDEVGRAWEVVGQVVYFRVEVKVVNSIL